MSVDTSAAPEPSLSPPRQGGTRALWRLRAYIWPYSWALVLMFSTAVIGVFVSLAIPLVTKAMIDGPIADHEVGPILPLGLLALALGIAEAGLILIRRWVQATAVLGFETAIRDDLYRHMQALPMEFHGRWQSGQLLSRVTVDLSAIRRFMGFGLLFLIINILQLTVVTALLIHLYLPLGMVVLVSAIPIIWLSKRFESRYVVVSRRVQDEQGDVATSVEEAAIGYRVVKSFGRSAYSNANFRQRTEKLYGTSMEKVKLSSRFWTFLEIIPNLSLVFVLLLGALAVGREDLTLGTLVAFITLMLQLIWPLEALGVILAMAQEAMTASDRVLEIFDTKSSITGGPRKLSKPQGDLRFNNVSFHFPTETGTGHYPVVGENLQSPVVGENLQSPVVGENLQSPVVGENGQSPAEAGGSRAAVPEPVLRGVDLHVLPGETVAIVGATGSGKTALTGLVPRLYDVTGGSITIDGVDIRELTLDSLRTIVATAFEDPTLFSMSARENITLGRPDASDDDVDAAVETAQASFVYDLPWGLDTRIGEQGMSLSGGQRQRLALARAVLAKPRILVLDDTLSALDVHTEALVEKALRLVLRDATGIVVAHRASTVMLADKVALLQDGTITHVGSHHDLLASVPAYRDLLGGDELDDERISGGEVVVS